MSDVVATLHGAGADLKFQHDVMRELVRARTKFPEQDATITMVALTEEVGELAQALLHLKFEPAKGKSYADLYAEAVQVAVMAMRVALDTEVQP